MNKLRRTQLEEAISLIEKAKEIVENCYSEEQECFDNLSEGLQASERGQQYQTNADNLQCAVNEFDTIINYIYESIES